MDPVHIGLEHPNALWLGVVGLVSFAAGAGAMVVSRRRHGEADVSPPPASDGDRR